MDRKAELGLDSGSVLMPLLDYGPCFLQRWPHYQVSCLHMVTKMESGSSREKRAAYFLVIPVNSLGRLSLVWLRSHVCSRANYCVHHHIPEDESGDKMG